MRRLSRGGSQGGRNLLSKLPESLLRYRPCRWDLRKSTSGICCLPKKRTLHSSAAQIAICCRPAIALVRSGKRHNASPLVAQKVPRARIQSGRVAGRDRSKSEGRRARQGEPCPQYPHAHAPCSDGPKSPRENRRERVRGGPPQARGWRK